MPQLRANVGRQAEHELLDQLVAERAATLISG
jgi:hypothetical protein